jgi:hypothetical protein
LLQVPVLKPRQRVEIFAPARQLLGLRQIDSGLEGHDVRRHDVVPHPELDEDVRRHVQRVRGGRRDLGIGARGVETQNRVIRIVERVDDVVRGARMLRIALEDLLRDRRGLHRVACVADAGAPGAEQRQCIQTRDFVVRRVFRVELAHDAGVGDVARQLVAGAEQHFQ